MSNEPGFAPGKKNRVVHTPCLHRMKIRKEHIVPSIHKREIPIKLKAWKAIFGQLLL